MIELENGRPKNYGAIPTRRKRLSPLQSTRSVRKISSHFKYLKNPSRGLHVSWQPDKGDLTGHTAVGLVSRQWDAVDLTCVLCDRPIHDDWASRSASSWQCACPFYSSHAGFSGKTIHHPCLSVPLEPRFGSLRLLAFPKAKITVEREENCNAIVTQYTSSVNGISLPND